LCTFHAAEKHGLPQKYVGVSFSGTHLGHCSPAGLSQPGAAHVRLLAALDFFFFFFFFLFFVLLSAAAASPLLACLDCAAQAWFACVIDEKSREAQRRPSRRRETTK
jgi:hypothetical protein